MPLICIAVRFGGRFDIFIFFCSGRGKEGAEGPGGCLRRIGEFGGGVYTREMGTICPFGVFSHVLQYLLLQNWPFSL